MGRHRANERSLDGSPGKIEARVGRPIHGPIEATSANAVRAARWLLRRDSRVVGGAIVRSGPAFLELRRRSEFHQERSKGHQRT